MPRYLNRTEAGYALAEQLTELTGRSDALVLGLARGGIPVAAAVAGRLGLDWDLLLVRKLATARQPEFAIGAVAMVGDHLTTIANPSLRTMRSPSSAEFDRALQRESTVLRQRAADYRRFRSARPLAGRSLVLVDDGMATGVTMRAAVAATPGTAVVAVPVASAEACRSLLEAGATVVCPWPRDDFGAVSMYYERFEQLSDQDVHRLLQQ